VLARFTGRVGDDRGFWYEWGTCAGNNGDPALIHDVILASASIPGVFPPVLIEVEADGRRYDELHVGGGVTAQLFFSPDMPIMSRSIDTLISTQSIGNLAELYIVAREQGLGYQLAYIPQRRGRRTPGPTSPSWRRC